MTLNAEDRKRLITFGPTEDEYRTAGLVLARAQDVERYMAIKPKLVLKADFFPGITMFYGYEVIRGEEFGVFIPSARE